MRLAFWSKAGASESEDELCSEEQEASQLILLLLLSLRFWDFDRPLLLLLEDLLLDDPCDEDEDLRFEADETFAATNRSVFPEIEAGDLGGSWFGAIIFILFVFKLYDRKESSLLDVLIVDIGEFIVANCFCLSPPWNGLDVDILMLFIMFCFFVSTAKHLTAIRFVGA